MLTATYLNCIELRSLHVICWIQRGSHFDSFKANAFRTWTFDAVTHAFFSQSNEPLKGHLLPPFGYPLKRDSIVLNLSMRLAVEIYPLTGGISRIPEKKFFRKRHISRLDGPNFKLSLKFGYTVIAAVFDAIKPQDEMNNAFKSDKECSHFPLFDPQCICHERFINMRGFKVTLFSSFREGNIAWMLFNSLIV